MTCREFKHSAASLTLWELVQAPDREVQDHADECAACGAWLGRQRALAASMQTLQTRTSGLEAGPSVERALLRAFRQVAPVHAAGVEECTTSLRLAAMPNSTPLALRLSRFFEIGAYVAVAAAIVVVVFLGVRILQRRSAPAPVQSQARPAATKPVLQTAPVVAANVSAKASPANTQVARTAAARRHERVQPAGSGARANVGRASTEDAASDADAGYVALMFCDPLSCAAESQVVRMELPAGQSSQPQVADVVVGYDGLVRAVRFVN